jgi:DNA-binding NtrC family response regulator
MLQSPRGALAFLPRGDVGSRDLLKQYLWRHGLITDETERIVGTSVPLLAALRAARLARTNERHVLLRGERGTGKELFARYVHSAERPDSRPFVVVDSGTLTPELFASELFGHVRGAFTGAERDRVGRIAEANGGDLFLDEIGNMPAGVQRGLLRVIERRELTRVGSTTPQQVDVRMISATNRDIERAAHQDGEFIPDLLDRLKEGGTVSLPPLRDRREDIPALVALFVRDAEAQFGAMKRLIEHEAIALLQAYDWPGNIRELRNVVFDAVNRHRDIEHLDAAHISLPSQRDVPVPSDRSTEADRQGGSLGRVFAAIDRLDVDHLEREELIGLLPRLEVAFGRLKAAVTKRAFERHMRRNAGDSKSRILVQPAVSMLRDEPSLSATQAYDAIIRMHNENPETGKLWDDDAILSEAYRRSMANRRGPRRRTTDAESDPVTPPAGERS